MLHAPSITTTSSLTFAPPVAMPHTEMDGPHRLEHLVRDDRARGGHDLHRVDRPFPVEGRFGDTRVDLARSATPASIPAAGGTQTVSVSLTPRRAAGFATITIDPASIAPGATVDPFSIVPPAADPTGVADTQLAPGNGAVTWSTSRGAVGTTYTLTVTVIVPAQPGTRLFKAAVTGEVELVSTLGTDTGTSTSTADPVLGGTIAYSSTDAVQWTRRLLDTVDIDLAGASTPTAPADHFVVQASAERSPPASRSR